MKVESFEDLRTWQGGIELVKEIYLLTKSGEISKDFGLRDQIRRASVSIPTNIAEGFERQSTKEYLYFLNIAKGSSGEVRSLLRVSLEIGYLNEIDYERVTTLVVMLSKQLFKQMNAIKSSINH
jgi:four helix bundle protein